MDHLAEEEAKRRYNAELMWIMAQNDFVHYGGKSFRFPRYGEIFSGDKRVEDSRTGEEIIADVRGKLLKIAEGGNHDAI